MSVPLYWHASDNFGDALAPWIVKRVTREDVIYVDPKSGPEGVVPYLVTGSILSWAIWRGIVWGAGCAFESDLEPSKITPPSAKFRVIATRGPLTKKLVEEAGHAPVTVGDPALLLPRFYTPRKKAKKAVGIVCSWVDYVEVEKHYRGIVPVLNASSPIEEVIDTIASWDIVVSSCLHGLVAAVAYGKAVVWAEFSDRMLGNGFKFHDFFALFDDASPRLLGFSSTAAFETAAKTFKLPDLDALYDCCPFLLKDESLSKDVHV